MIQNTKNVPDKTMLEISSALRELYKKPSNRLKNNIQPAAWAIMGVNLFCFIIYKGRYIKLNRCYAPVSRQYVWMNEWGGEWPVVSNLLTTRYSHVENSSCKQNFSPYICSDLVPGLIIGIKREVRCKSGAIPVAVRVVNGKRKWKTGLAHSPSTTH